MLTARIPLDPLDYLAREAEVPRRLEYVNGHAYALSGSTKQHAKLVTNLVGHAFNALPRRPRCDVFSQCVKVHVPERNSFYYPDVVATCEPPPRERYIVREPCFIVEVLSPSTASIDRREKRAAYMTLPSLEQYLILDQDRMRADLYCRSEKGWTLRSFASPIRQWISHASTSCSPSRGFIQAWSFRCMLRTKSRSLSGSRRSGIRRVGAGTRRPDDCEDQPSPASCPKLMPTVLKPAST